MWSDGIGRYFYLWKSEINVFAGTIFVEKSSSKFNVLFLSWFFWFSLHFAPGITFFTLIRLNVFLGFRSFTVSFSCLFIEWIKFKFLLFGNFVKISILIRISDSLGSMFKGLVRCFAHLCSVRNKVISNKKIKDLNWFFINKETLLFPQLIKVGKFLHCSFLKFLRKGQFIDKNELNLTFFTK